MWAGRADATVGRYQRAPASLPAGELHIHVWEDTTLRELTEMVKEVCASARAVGARLHLSLVYPCKTREFKVRPVGEVLSGAVGDGDAKSLAACRFEPGDYLDVRVDSS